MTAINPFTLLPGTEVRARDLSWIVVDTRPQGEQTLVRLRGKGDFSGFEIDLLTPFEAIEPVNHKLEPEKAGSLPNWLVYHQAFLLEQSLGPDAFLSVQPGRLRVEPYQLVPLSRALRMSRPRLLLADDVGLGKTIEAGLVIAELMARRRAHRVLVVTPAGPLLQQWQSEMSERFGLRLVQADRAAMDVIRRGAELGANPFDHLPLAIASMDFLKQDRVLDELERALPFDLVVIDEAHHYSETGNDDTDRSDTSQRRRLADVLARQSDALLLLTATPHDGYERSFASLLELLDPSLVDDRGLPRKDFYFRHVVRRLKKHIKIIHPITGEVVGFPERKLEPVAVAPDETTHPAFVDLHRALLRFAAPALKKALRNRQYDDALAYLALLKRSTSTIAALENTLKVVYNRIRELATTKQEEQEERRQRRQSLKVLQRKMARFGVLTLDEESERERLEQEELAQQLSLLDRELSSQGRIAAQTETTAQALEALLAKTILAREQDLKLEQLLAEVRHIRQEEPKANILIYTEYVDSLAAAEEFLNSAHVGPILTIHGARNDSNVNSAPDRRAVTERFRNHENLILISTDAAAEGLNLHERCHNLIHLELPWNPNRLEQRNGRIDRYGQWKTPVVRYFYLCGTFEERILARLMAKYERQRDRLKFMPNTLGLDASTLSEEGLFAAFSTQPEMSGLPCRRLEFQEEGGQVDDPQDADLQALLGEIEKSLRHFENAAKTHQWLSNQGAAADDLAQSQALLALEAGRKVGSVDLSEFVSNAVLAAGGQVRSQLNWKDIYLPPGWAYGLDNLPGWDADKNRLRLTTDMAVNIDDQEQPVSFLGRAHPLVRRAIEHVHQMALGQASGLDGRISAAKAPDGKKSLIYTFLGRVESQIGAEFERLIAVKVTPDSQVQLYTDSTDWMPDQPLSTKGLWEKEFKSWGEAAQEIARQAAQASFDEQIQRFTSRHQAQLAQERRELDEWLLERVESLTGSVDSNGQLSLFQELSSQAQTPLQRLKDFVVLAPKGSKERSAGETAIRLFENRLNHIQRRTSLNQIAVQPLGLLMSL